MQPLSGACSKIHGMQNFNSVGNQIYVKFKNSNAGGTEVQRTFIKKCILLDRW